MLSNLMRQFDRAVYHFGKILKRDRQTDNKNPYMSIMYQHAGCWCALISIN